MVFSLFEAMCPGDSAIISVVSLGYLLSDARYVARPFLLFVREPSSQVPFVFPHEKPKGESGERIQKLSSMHMRWGDMLLWADAPFLTATKE